MTRPRITLRENTEGLCQAAAQTWVKLAQGAVAQRGRFTVALSGGSTPRTLYRMLATPSWQDQVDWSKVEFFWGDERTVPPDHPDSNFRMAQETLLEQLVVSPLQVHRMEAEREDLAAAARDYQEGMAAVLQGSTRHGLPSLDLVLLGMGPDGHTASLFPETGALTETIRWVVPNEVPQLETWRMTLTAPLINAARTVLFLVTGAAKSGRLAEVLCGPQQPLRLPSQMIGPTAGTLTWLVDRAAAGKLPPAIVSHATPNA